MTYRWGNNENSERHYFLGLKITDDSDCSHEIKRHLFLGKKAMTNLDSVLKSILNCFTNKGSYSQSYGFSSCYVWIWVVAVQLLSGVWFLVIPWTAAHHASLSFTISQSLLKLTSIELVMPSNHLILCHPLLLLPSIFPKISVSSNESVLCIRYPKYWIFSLSISPSKEYSGLISSRIDWFCLLAVQDTLKSLLQHHNSKGSILWHSAFFMVRLSHPYMTTGKTIVLTRQTFVGKVMPLLFNTLSRFVIDVFPRSKHLLISWLQSPSAVILEPKKIKSVTVSIVSPSIWHKGWDHMLWSLVFESWAVSQLFHFSLSPSSRGSFILLCFLPLGWCHLHIWSCCYFS